MNCDGKMSFGDLVFPNNPSQIRITQNRTVPEQMTLSGESAVSEYGRSARRITGEGEFFGDDCIGQFEALRQRFEKGGAGILYIPSQRPMPAYFRELRMIAADIGRIVRYAFEFVECTDGHGRAMLSGRVSDGVKRLWDYAYESGIDISALLELNPDVKRPDVPIPAGRSVRLC